MVFWIRRRNFRKRKPEILLVPDKPNWAFDFIADDIMRFAADKYNFTKYYKHHLPRDEDYDRFDAVYFFWWAKGSIKSAKELGIPRERCMTVISSYLSWIKRGWSREELHDILSFYRGVGTISQGLYEHFTDLHSHVYLTPYGVDLDMFPEIEPIPDDRPGGRLIVGWAGSLKHDKVKKGVSEFIEPAVAAVEGAELRLALAGESRHPLGKEYQRSRMHEFYNSIDVCVCASKFEGAPLPIIEAGACGRPVVTTAVGIAPQLVRNGYNGFIVRREVEAIAAVLRKLRNDRSLLQQMGQNHRSVVRAKWSWEQRIGEYVKMFDSVLGRNLLQWLGDGTRG